MKMFSGLPKWNQEYNPVNEIESFKLRFKFQVANSKPASIKSATDEKLIKPYQAKLQLLVERRQLVLDNPHQVEVNFSGLVLRDALLDDGGRVLQPLFGFTNRTVVDRAFAKSVLENKTISSFLQSELPVMRRSINC